MTNNTSSFEFEEEEILIHETYIRPDEKNFIKYTKLGLLDFLKKLETDSNWSLISDKNSLAIYLCYDGSPINKDFNLGKHTYKLNKSKLNRKFTIKELYSYIYHPEKRSSYDPCIKQFKKFYGDEESYVFRLACFAPVFFISERDSVEKRVSFEHEATYYSFSSSIHDKFVPPNKDFIRIFYYINFFTIRETQDEFIFTGYSQLDMKMSIPEWIISITLPWKMGDWYAVYINYLLSIKEETKTEKVIKEKVEGKVDNKENIFKYNDEEKEEKDLILQVQQ